MYKNLKVGKKLLIGFGIVALLSVLMMGVALYFLNQVGNLAHNLYIGPYVATTQAMGVRRDLNLMGKEIRSAILAKDLDKYRSVILEAKDTMAQRIDALKIAFKGDQQLIANLESAEDKLAAERDKVFAAIESNDYTKATELVLGSYYEAFVTATTAADALFNAADALGTNFDAEAQSSAKIAMIVSIGLLAVCLGLAVIMAILSTRSITRPMQKVDEAMGKMAKGSLKVDIDYESKDELGVLAKNMRALMSGISNIIEDISYLLGQMANGNFDIKTKAGEAYVGDYAPILAGMRNINTKLSDVLSQINQSSEQVSSGSDQVSSGAQALSQGATEQASSVEELAATVTEISEQVKTNASNARDASEIVNHTGSEIAASNEKMQLLIEAMSEISTASQEIGKVIKTIEDIAFQTNILALNAAVEAARAGNAGKGFAVVADEVRNLASKSAEAAKGTTALIEGSVKAVEKGTSIADDAAKSLLVVVDGANRAAKMVDQISVASSEQAQSIAQVTQGIDQISAVVQTNSATAEESAAASEELSGQAALLKDLVGRFKLKSDEENVVTVMAHNVPKTAPRYDVNDYAGSSKY